jgi:hypothetical protein
MTEILALACFVTGFIAAWLLRTILLMAQISWSQDRMQRKVRYWQGEAIHARSVAEQLSVSWPPVPDQNLSHQTGRPRAAASREESKRHGHHLRRRTRDGAAHRQRNRGCS